MAQRHPLAVIAISMTLLIARPGRGDADPPDPSTSRLSLQGALARARAANPDLRAAAQEVEIARGRAVKAGHLSQFNPEIGGDAAHRSQSGAGGSRSTTDYGVSLSQEVEVGLQRGARVAEARENVARAEAEVRDRQRLLDADVKRAFFAVLGLEKRVALLRRIEDLDGRVRDAAVARAKAGESSSIEANLAAIRYGEARKEALVADAELAGTRATLRRLLDLERTAPLVLAGELRGVAKPLVTERAVARALEGRPDLTAAGREVDRIKAERTLTRRLAVPNPTIGAFYREEDIDTNRIAGAGLRIPLPLFDRRQGELVTLAGREVQARYQVDAVRRRIEQEVVAALERYDAAGRTLAVFEDDILARVDENTRFIETAYRAGKIDLFQLIVVQNDLVNAQLSYLDTLVRFREAEVDLERALGGAL